MALGIKVIVVPGYKQSMDEMAGCPAVASPIAANDWSGEAANMPA
tara:strand:- start:29200 stop:29334 length:135 start_codon:yes stop_codon:yes gene_type:complete